MTHSPADAETEVAAFGADAPAETTLSRKEMRALRESGTAENASADKVSDDARPAAADDISEDARPAAAKEKERGLIRYIGNALMGALLVILVIVGAAAIVVPAVTGSTALTVMTSSMEPGLPPGTLVVVKPTAPADIREGMVLTYQLSSGDPTLITHRVVQQLHVLDGSYLWITQGDNNPSPDLDPVQEVQVKGTVWYAIPYLGWVSAGLTGEWKAWLLPIAVLALFGYAGWMIISSMRDKARKRRDA